MGQGLRSDPRRGRPRSPAEARRRLEQGNRAFAQLGAGARDRIVHVVTLDPRDLGHGPRAGVAPAQEPFAAVLGCSDARVPVEMVFQQRSNDLFVVRVAGNGVGSDCLGSLRYAAQNFSSTLKLVVVLGHLQCGAVSAAVDSFLRPREYLALATNYPLRAIVDAMLVSVRSAAMALEQEHGSSAASQAGYRAALIEVSVVLNAGLAAFSLGQELASRACQVRFGVYDLSSRRVRLPLAQPRGSARVEVGLFAAPAREEHLRRLASRVVRSASVRALLAAPAPGR